MSDLLNARDYATLVLNGGSLLLVLGVFSTSLFTRIKGRFDVKLFNILMLLNAMMALANTVSYVVDGKDIPEVRIIKLISTTIFYLTMAFTALCWRWYTSVRFGNGLKTGWRRNLLFTVAILLILIFVVNLFTGWFFAVDSDGRLHNGILYIPVYIVMVIYVFTGFFTLAEYGIKKGKSILIPLLFYMSPVVLGGILTFAVPDGPSFAPMGIAVSILFTHSGTVTEVIEDDRRL